MPRSKRYVPSSDRENRRVRRHEEIVRFRSCAQNTKKLHVVSGWTDVPADVWKRYVRSCVKLLNIEAGGKGQSMFEAGCGCLGFLEPIRVAYPRLTFGGMDGSPSFRKWIDAAKGYDASKFYQGMLPKGLKTKSSVSYDFVVCNSVFQYLTHEQAAETVSRMLELVAPGGFVLVCDVCDMASKDIEEKFMKKHVKGYGEGKRHTYYAKTWWKQFDAEVETFHSDADGYVRRHTRYQARLKRRSD